MADWDHTGTGNVAHNNAVMAANNVRNTAYKAAAGNQKAIAAADAVWARAVLASAKINNVFAPNVSEMLWELTGSYT
jgi:hypothetical protein